MLEPPWLTPPACRFLASARIVPSMSIGAVLVEPVVLDRDDRRLHDLGDLVERHDLAVLLVELRDLLALGVQDDRHLGQRRLVEVLGLEVHLVRRRHEPQRPRRPPPAARSPPTSTPAAAPMATSRMILDATPD